MEDRLTIGTDFLQFLTYKLEVSVNFNSSVMSNTFLIFTFFKQIYYYELKKKSYEEGPLNFDKQFSRSRRVFQD